MVCVTSSPVVAKLTTQPLPTCSQESLAMEFDVWSQSFVAAMTTLWSKVASFIPDLIAALIIVLLG